MNRKHLGKSLIRDQRKKKGNIKDGFRHTADLPDGFDWARLNLRSVTEQSSVDDFLDQVKLAENDFNKEFSNIKILTREEAAGVLSEQEKKLILETQEEYKHVLSIPRRPLWSTTDTKEELDAKEREAFLKWRKSLCLLKGKEHVSLTPYEMNLEVWRQLWRVVEKSDVVVQIIDARNPLLFRCEDLETYVKEVDQRKQNVLLLNKADFLSQKQREMWASYFEDVGMKVVFFSALQQTESTSQIKKEAEDEGEFTDDDDESTDSEDEVNDLESDATKQGDHLDSNFENKHCQDDEKDNKNVECNSAKSTENERLQSNSSCSLSPNDSQDDENASLVKNSADMLSKFELVSFLKRYNRVCNPDSTTTMVGMVGYPNVGKSSTINSVLSNKKVQVSSTPGKTKHFQTLIVDSELCFCDCPGLVFPNFVSTKADMVINGILPVDQLTDHVAPVTLITNLIPRQMLEYTYSIVIPLPQEGRDPNSAPTAEEFLNAHGYMRGFMTQRGLPDNARSARYILKDFLKGKLLYCKAPPGCDEEMFQKYSLRSVPDVALNSSSRISAKLKSFISSNEIDKNFFRPASNQAHVKGAVQVGGYNGIAGQRGTLTADATSVNKPWKKHHNRNKKEKLRRIHTTRP